MNDWWKAPVLQGEDNDYGQYDYLIEEIPQDYVKWVLDKQYKWKCHDCGRETHLLHRSEHFFHTLDGWDSLDYASCWRCEMKGYVRAIKWKTKKAIKKCIDTIKMTIELYQIGHHSLKYCYDMAKMIVR